MGTEAASWTWGGGEDPGLLAPWAGLAHRSGLAHDFPACSCALQRDLLIQGRLYISPNWLCFHASLFGKDIKVVMSGKSCQGSWQPQAQLQPQPEEGQLPVLWPWL